MSGWSSLADRLIARWIADKSIEVGRRDRLVDDLAAWLAAHIQEPGAELGDWLIEHADVVDVFADDAALLASVAEAAAAASDDDDAAEPEEPDPMQALVARYGRTWFVPETAAGDPLTTGTKFGGRPYLLAGEAWPRCGRCQRVLPLFVQLDLAGLPADVGAPHRAGLVQLFYCTDECEAECEAWEPYARSVVARWIGVAGPAADVAPRAPQPHDPAPCVVVRWSAGGQELPMFDEPIAIADADRQPLADYRHTEDRTFRAHAGDKLGGWPAWVQAARYPACRTCKQPMAYLLQLDSDGLSNHMFGDTGTGHLFQCATHAAEVAFAWACC